MGDTHTGLTPIGGAIMQRYRWVSCGALLVVFCATAVAFAQQSTSPQPNSMSRQGAQRFTPPRASAGYGLFYGYPVPYQYFYSYPAGFQSSYALTFYDPAPYLPPSAPPSMSPPPRNTYSNVESVVPGATNEALFACDDPNASVPCGGVSFDVLPGDAQVSVEGILVGTVDGFSPTQPPLALAPGVHYIEVRRPGYRTAVLEVMITGGEVTPYQGALEPLRTR